MPTSINKTELAAEVAAGLNIPKSQAEDAVQAVLNELAEAFQAGQAVKLSGFGSFRVRETKARTGRNPKTGAPVDIPAGRKVTFKFTGKL